MNKTPREIAELIWEVFRQNPLWGRWRIAMTLWGLGVFVAASTVRNILLRPRPEASAPAPAQAKEPVKPRQIIARYRITSGPWIGRGCGDGTSGPPGRWWRQTTSREW